MYLLLSQFFPGFLLVLLPGKYRLGLFSSYLSVRWIPAPGWLLVLVCPPEYVPLDVPLHVHAPVEEAREDLDDNGGVGVAADAAVPEESVHRPPEHKVGNVLRGKTKQ